MSSFSPQADVEQPRGHRGLLGARRTSGAREPEYLDSFPGAV
jgi:hypothetical protein